MPAPRKCTDCPRPALPGKHQCARHVAIRTSRREVSSGPSGKRGRQHPLAGDKAWLDLSAAFLNEHPRCARCMVKGRRNVPAVHVDHVRPVRQFPDLAYELANLQPLCRSCHGIKGAHERRGDCFDYMRRRKWIIAT